MTKKEIELQADRVARVIRRSLVTPGLRGGRKVSTLEAKVARGKVLEEIDQLRKMVAMYGIGY